MKLGLAGNRCFDTLDTPVLCAFYSLGLAGNRCFDTLLVWVVPPRACLGWPEIAALIHCHQGQGLQHRAWAGRKSLL